MFILIDSYPTNNHYTVICDGAPFCYTDSDDDGMKLKIALAKMEAIQTARRLQANNN